MRGFKLSRPANGGRSRSAREEAEAEAAGELRGVLERAGLPTDVLGDAPPGDPVVPLPEPEEAGPSGGAGPVDPPPRAPGAPADGPSPAVRRVRKSPPRGASGRPGTGARAARPGA